MIQALVGTKDDWQSLEASAQACVRVGFRGLQSIRFICNCCVLNEGNYLYFRISSTSLQPYRMYIQDCN